MTAVLAGVSSPSFAETSLGPITNDFDENTQPYADDVKIVGRDNVGNGSAIDITTDNKNIVVATEGENHSIEVKSDVYGIKLGYDAESAGSTDNVSISLNATGNNVITVSESAKSDVGDGINISNKVNNGSITLTAKGNNEINANSENGDAIYIDTGAKADVMLKAGAINKIVAGNNGIDNRGSQSITLEAVGANIINGGSAQQSSSEGNQGDGIRVEGSGTVNVTGLYNKISGFDEGLYIHAQADAEEGIKVTASRADENGFGNIISGDDNGIESAGAAGIEVTAEDSSNKIIGGKNGVLNSEAGTIYIKAGTVPSSMDINLLAGNDENVSKNNIYTIGEENGILSTGSGNTNYEAQNNNYIIGTTNGIYSKGSGTISLVAGHDNIIGQYIDEEGSIVTSKTGINVEEGTISLAAGDANNIFATNNGILASGTDGKTVNIVGKNNSLTVGGEGSSNDVAGIYFSNSTQANININNGLDDEGRPLYAEQFTITAKSAGDAMGIKFDGSSENSVNVFADSISIDANSTSERANAIWLQSTTSDNIINLNANDSVYLHATMGQSSGSGAVVWFTGNNNKLSITGGNNTITSEQTKASMIGIHVEGSNNDIDIKALSGDNAIYSQNVGLEWRANGGSFDLISEQGSNFITSTNNNAVSIVNIDNLLLQAAGTNNIQAGRDGISFITESRSGTVKLSANNNIINAGGNGIYLTKGTTGTVELEAKNGNNEITADKNHGIGVNSSSVTLKAEEGKNIIHSYSNYSNPYVPVKWDSGIYAVNQGSQVTLIAQQNELDAELYGITAGSNKTGGIVSLTATVGDNIISSKEVGIRSAYNGQVTLTAQQNNRIRSTSAVDYAVYVNSAQVELDAVNNIIEAGDNLESSLYGNSYALAAYANATLSVTASESNQFSGLIYGRTGAITTITGKVNTVYSSSMVDGAGDLEEDTTEGEASFKDKTVISALYAEEGANISLTGASNYLRTYADSAEYENTLERVVWAYNGKEGKGTSINIDGYTQISTDSYTESRNSADIALAAGTAVNLDEQDVSDSKDMAVEDRAKVIVDYADLVDENGNTIASSSITGDILAAYQGYVDIKPKESSDAGIDITGNILAGNNGIVNINLGKEGSLTGRADDYGDAGVIENSEHTKFFNPAFSNAIHEGGAVNLTMGEGSRWDVTGQSWVTSVNTGIFDSTADDVSYLPMIDLTHANNDINQKAAGLTVYSFSGDSKFRMNLDGNELNKSNMLYMKNANGTYYIELEDTVSRDEINTTLHDGLRFATVGKDSNVEFHVGSINNGVFNIEYEIGQDNYDETVAENERYNGSQLDEQKPGDSTVKEFFGNDGTPVEEVSGESEIATANAVMALAETSDEAADIAQQDNLTGAVNHKIIDIKSATTSDIGKTVIDMSRANYANAVYMDTLNKRQGEARFVGDTDHGVWVRLRHDNIGKEDSFRSHNTMVEVGFEQRDVNDYGEFHTGFALDYMNGSLDYHTVDGDGDIERYGVWFYTTFLGNDGQYADLILKYGHLKNDFGFNTRSQGEHVTGAYTNETASLSAEYGWKFSNSHNYYIEPQAQLQYTYVTGADYTTSQGTKVDLDSIHSLIGRVGIRAGKDFLDWEHPVSLYARADALHEFLGDQDIYAYDDTGVMDISYENDDTWYTVGLGLTVKSSENTYFFIEGETALGADNEDTYTFSGGFRHSF